MKELNPVMGLMGRRTKHCRRMFGKLNRNSKTGPRKGVFLKYKRRKNFVLRSDVWHPLFFELKILSVLVLALVVYKTA